MFIKASSRHQLFVVVYVEDILVIESDPTQVEQMIVKLGDMFSLKDLGFLDLSL